MALIVLFLSQGSHLKVRGSFMMSSTSSFHVAIRRSGFHQCNPQFALKASNGKSRSRGAWGRSCATRAYASQRQLSPLSTKQRRPLSHTAYKSPDVIDRKNLSVPTYLEQGEEMKYWENCFSLKMPEGLCVGLTLLDQPDDPPPHALSSDSTHSDTHWIQRYLHPEEIFHGLNLNLASRRNSFLAGRLALRAGLANLGCTHVEKEGDITLFSMLKDEFGRPNIPPGFLGSISHKKTTGVALVAADDDDGHSKKGIGIDVEQTLSRRPDIGRAILTKDEQANLGNVHGLPQDVEVMVRFSLKESIYKAMHPIICQKVGWREVEVTPHSNGTATVNFRIANNAHHQFESVTAHWRLLDSNLILSSASVTGKDQEQSEN